MAIRMTFPHAIDSPTGQPEVRLRYGFHKRDGRTVPTLTYRHGRATELTREAWAGYVQANAVITADTDRERAIVSEALGIDIT